MNSYLEISARFLKLVTTLLKILFNTVLSIHPGVLPRGPALHLMTSMFPGETTIHFIIMLFGSQTLENFHYCLAMESIPNSLVFWQF